MSKDCECNTILLKHDSALSDIEWLIQDLYEKVGYLKGENDKLKRKLDKTIVILDELDVDIEDLYARLL